MRFRFTVQSCTVAICVVQALCLAPVTLEAEERFHAKGLISPTKPESHQQGVVQVFFDLLPTSMRFNAPSYPCLVTENGIQYSNGFAETYDPRRNPDAKETSFEPGFDDLNQYSRMWIESQNDARIVVRVRGALVSDEGKHIAHEDFDSRCQYGKGDWVDDVVVGQGKDFRVGYERTPVGTNLILWIRFNSKDPIHMSLRQVRK